MLYKWKVSGSYNFSMTAEGDQVAIDLARKAIADTMTVRKTAYIEEITVSDHGTQIIEFHSVKDFKAYAEEN